MDHSVSKYQSLFELVSRLWNHLSRRRRRQFCYLLILTVLASFVEIISIGAILPFLGVITAPERVFAHPAAQPFIKLLSLTNPSQLLLPLTLAFGFAAIFAGIMRLLLLYVNTRLSFAAGADLSIDIYRKTLYQPYVVHIARNSSEVINSIIVKTNSVIYNVLLPILQIFTSGIMLLAILLAILAIDPVIAMATFSGFGLIYVGITRIIQKRLSLNSQLIATDSTIALKSLQEGLGGIRDVLLDGSQAFYCNFYREADLSLRYAQRSTAFIANSPRYAMESLGMVLISLIVYVLARNSHGAGISNAIPILGALAMGAQRMLPAIQQGYSSFAYIKASQESLVDSLALLDQPLPDYVNQPVTDLLPFKHKIDLTNLSFRYSEDTPWVFRNLELSIPKGSRIGIIGTTGSGKSTLLDIIMGLLEPDEGTLAIDGTIINQKNVRAWQKLVAHVPQSIFLADCSIEENIAFGIPKDQIDSAKVREVASQAQLAATIESWPQGYGTFVGERGVRLSGGQRQRIGIARALYKNADVIVFDEATSALDNETEQTVMHAIECLSEELTIIIIAHRLTTLRRCSEIIELGDQCIKRYGTYSELIGTQLSQ